MINFVAWIVAGGVLGWGASVAMHTDDQQDVFLDIITGISGAALGGWSIWPMAGGALASQCSLTGLAIALLGATLLPGLVNLVRRGATP